MSRSVSSWPRPLLVLSVVAILVLVSSTTVLAASWATTGAKVQQVKAVASDSQELIESATWTDVPGSSLTMKVARGKAIFLVTFSAASHCWDSTVNGGHCMVRVLANGQALQPGEVFFGYGPTDLHISAGAHSMQFFTDPLPVGTYEFKVQWRSNSTTTFQLNSRTLSVLRAKV